MGGFSHFISFPLVRSLTCSFERLVDTVRCVGAVPDVRHIGLRAPFLKLQLPLKRSQVQARPVQRYQVNCGGQALGSGEIPNL